MSAIFGIVHLDGQPVDPASLQAMQAAMQYWGPDGSELWHAGALGLGHLMLHNTPESLYETMPLHSRSGDVVLTASARIDNRDELCEALRVPYPERATIPDGVLILKAHERWGEACPDHLLGDWVFAVWDGRQRRLFIARDHHGFTGLYYYYSPRVFAFASCLKGLLALPMIPRRLHELRLVQVIASWPEQGAPTAYEEILRLPPAHALTLTADRLDVRRYWRLEDAPEVRCKSDQEYGEAFFALYTEAVRCRLRSHRPVGATLSGGLDTGSVCALAARDLRNTGRRLPAFSSVPIYDPRPWVSPNRIGDETPFIEATSQFAGTIDVHYIRAADVSPLQGIRRALWLHDEPGHAARNQYWMTALFATAQQHNIGTLLIGQNGNATISWTGRPSAADPLLFFKEGRYRQALRSLARVLLPAVCQRWYMRLRAGKDPWMKYAALNRELALRLDLTQLMRSRGHDPALIMPTDTRAARYRILRPGSSFIGALGQESGAGYTLELRDPTGDKRILEFCLGIPDEQYCRNGHNRWLIRRAMTGLLPSLVRWNTRRGFQAADVGQRILDSQEEIAGVLAQLERSDLARHYLELPVMQQVFRSLQTRIDPQNTMAGDAILLRGMMAGLFLLRFDAPAPERPEPIDAPSVREMSAVRDVEDQSPCQRHP
jgi:asparagine synthase (glutamine-hydrolysing)